MLPPTYLLRPSFTFTERHRYITQLYKFSSHCIRFPHPYLHNIFQFSRDVTGCANCNFIRLFVPREFTNFGKRSFFYRGAVLCNSSLLLNASQTAAVSLFRNLYFNSNTFLFLFLFFILYTSFCFVTVFFTIIFFVVSYYIHLLVCFVYTTSFCVCNY